MADLLFEALRITDRATLARFAKASGVDSRRLRFYNAENLLPSEPDLTAIADAAGLSITTLMLSMGRIDRRLAERVREHAGDIAALLDGDPSQAAPPPAVPPVVFETELGRLHHGDCLDLLPSLGDESVELVFADPPFNLRKLYPSGIDDDLKARQYVEWTERWLEECVRVLTFGGSLFLWNLPKWNILFAEFLSQRMRFRHWITVDIKYSLPISGATISVALLLVVFHKRGKAGCLSARPTPYARVPALCRRPTGLWRI